MGYIVRLLFGPMRRKLVIFEMQTELCRPEELTNYACFGYGTALGIREKDLIPHDDDIDILVAFNKSELVVWTPQ